MKFVMLTYTHMDRVADWDTMPEEDQKALVDEHIGWFQKHADHLGAGQELAYPPVAAELSRTDGELSIVDGPFAETKELLGGFVEIEADSLDEAKAIAAEWPNLYGAGNRVVLAQVAPPRNIR